MRRAEAGRAPWTVLVATLLLAGLPGCGGSDDDVDRIGHHKPPLLGGTPPGTGRAPDLACPATPKPGVVGPDYAGRVFNGGTIGGSQVNADFRGATFLNVTFNGDFTGADFSGATFGGGQVTYLDGNFTNACFKALRWSGASTLAFGALDGPAVLDGSDFSSNDLSSTAGFNTRLTWWSTRGVPLNMRLRNAVLACTTLTENQWPIDFDGADFSATHVGSDCLDPGRVLKAQFVSFRGVDLRGLSLAGWQVPDADFQNALLDDTFGWAGAGFARANFRNASLKRVNFEGAAIVGSDFSHADLEAASFAGLKLATDGGGTPTGFSGAHLKYVNFSGATLTNVRFDFASLYGPVGDGTPLATCQTDVAQCPDAATGRTCSCATMSGADLTGANFTGAFLYGVDFSSSSGSPTAISGTDFTDAVLVAANFQGATFSEDRDPNQGSRAVSFDGALLQGALFSGDAALDQVSFDGAYVDVGYDKAGATHFASSGLYWLVPEESTRFHGWTGPAQACVHLEYASPTTPPTAMQQNVCPDGTFYSDGCGTIVPRFSGQDLNQRWRPKSTLASRGGWYQKDATYEDKAASRSCNGTPTTSGW